MAIKHAEKINEIRNETNLLFEDEFSVNMDNLPTNMKLHHRQLIQTHIDDLLRTRSLDSLIHFMSWVVGQRKEIEIINDTSKVGISVTLLSPILADAFSYRFFRYLVIEFIKFSQVNSSYSGMKREFLIEASNDECWNELTFQRNAISILENSSVQLGRGKPEQIHLLERYRMVWIVYEFCELLSQLGQLNVSKTDIYTELESYFKIDKAQKDINKWKQEPSVCHAQVGDKIVSKGAGYDEVMRYYRLWKRNQHEQLPEWLLEPFNEIAKFNKVKTNK